MIRSNQIVTGLTIDVIRYGTYSNVFRRIIISNRELEKQRKISD